MKCVLQRTASSKTVDLLFFYSFCNPAYLQEYDSSYIISLNNYLTKYNNIIRPIPFLSPNSFMYPQYSFKLVASF